MSLHFSLEHLRSQAANGQRGFSKNRVPVDQSALRELLLDYDRLDAIHRSIDPVRGEGKYAEVLSPFLRMMEAELHANAHKGDRPGWLKMDPKTALLEIHYHLAKLQKATLDADRLGIIEYAADTANMAMMLVDICGLLARGPVEDRPQATFE